MSSISREDYDAVEDCLDHCANHFTLAYEVARRSHSILRRGDPLVPENNDRVVVVALREVAGGYTAAPAMKIDVGGNEVQDAESAESVEATELAESTATLDSAAGTPPEESAAAE